MPGSLIPSDLPAIMQQQGVKENPTTWLLENFQASEGATVGALVQGVLQTFRVPTIVPRLTEQGCVFLKDNRCTIHEVAPFGCAYFDMHMSREVGDGVSRHAVNQQLDSWRAGGSYAQAWQVLHEAGKLAPPLAERRENLKRATALIEGTPSDPKD